MKRGGESYKTDTFPDTHREQATPSCQQAADTEIQEAEDSERDKRKKLTKEIVINERHGSPPAANKRGRTHVDGPKK